MYKFAILLGDIFKLCQYTSKINSKGKLKIINYSNQDSATQKYLILHFKNFINYF